MNWRVPASIAVLVPAVAVPQEPEEVSRATDMFRGAKSAYALWPAEHLIGSDVASAIWSPSGKVILGVQRTRKLTTDYVRCFLLGIPFPTYRPAQTTVFGWSADDRKAVALWQTQEAVQIEPFAWIGHNDVAFTLVEAPTRRADGTATVTRALMMVDRLRGRTRFLTQWVSDEQGNPAVSLETSPAMPYAIVLLNYSSPRDPVQGDANGSTSAVIVREDGRVGAPIPLPSGPSYYTAFRDPTTSRGYLRGRLSTKPVDGERPKAKFTWLAIDEAKNKATPCDPPAKEVPVGLEALEDGPRELRVETSNFTVGQGSAARKIATTWIVGDGAPEKKGRPNAALVAANCLLAEVCPNDGAVLFVSAGSLFIRKIQRLSLDEFEAAASMEGRKAAMNKAKMAGLAALMYATDNDDVLPGKDGVADLFQPYLSDSATMDGFVYSFAGGNVTAVENPAETQLGYVDGEGGRAVVFLDGSVRWIKNGG